MKKNAILILSVLLALPLLSCKGKEPDPLLTNVLNIELKVGSEYERRTPQVAIWIEDLEGNYIDTLYVSYRGAKSKWRGGSSIRRPEALPVWSHKRGVKVEDGLYMPSQKMPLADSMTGASPKSSFIKQYPLGGKLTGKEYIIKVEINTSFDYNEFYKDNLPEESPYYNTGASGQPSLIYSSLVKIDSAGKTKLTLEGHGHPTGLDGSISTELKGITTAYQLIEEIIVEVKL